MSKSILGMPAPREIQHGEPLGLFDLAHIEKPVCSSYFPVLLGNVPEWES